MLNLGSNIINTAISMVSSQALSNKIALRAYVKNISCALILFIVGGFLSVSIISDILMMLHTSLINSGVNVLYANIIVLLLKAILITASFIVANRYVSRKLCLELETKNVA